MAVEPCPHVSPAMIAAGFHRCAVCENSPRAARPGKEDTSRQQAAVALARQTLAQYLDDLAAEATKQAKACRTKRGQPDMDRVHAEHRSVRQAEEALDLAVYDLQTARGADG